MTIGIVGLGYVGLPLAVAFAESGQRIVGIPTPLTANRDLAVSVTAHPGIDHGAIAATVPTVHLRGATRPVRETLAAAAATGKES